MRLNITCTIFSFLQSLNFKNKQYQEKFARIFLKFITNRSLNFKNRQYQIKTLINTKLAKAVSQNYINSYKPIYLISLKKPHVKKMLIRVLSFHVITEFLWNYGGIMEIFR